MYLPNSISGTIPCDCKLSLKNAAHSIEFSDYGYNYDWRYSYVRNRYQYYFGRACAGPCLHDKIPESNYRMACSSNFGCSLLEWADFSTNQSHPTCTNCPSGSIIGVRLSSSSNDCISVAMNFGLSIVVFIACVFFLLTYVYYGRIHRVAFVRMERIVHVLIMKYKLTIDALLSMQQYLKARKNSSSVVSAQATQEKSVSWWKVALFWLISLAAMLFLPIIFFAFIMWRRLLDTLILWNGWKSATDLYTPTIQRVVDEIKSHFPHIPDFIDVLFKVPKEFLDALSRIKVDLGAMKISCTGAQAPFLLLVQIIVFGIAMIVINSDYQIFKTNLFGTLLDSFKSVTASRGYRWYVLSGDERFHWSPYRYFRFLCYAAFAELLSFALDFPTVLKFCMPLVRYDAISEYIKSGFNYSWPPDWLVLLFPFAFVPWKMAWLVFSAHTGSQSNDQKYKYDDDYLYLTSSSSACDAAPGFEGLDSSLLFLTFYLSLFVVIPIFFEIGKAVAPGNRAIKPSAIQRIEPYHLGPRLLHLTKLSSDYCQRAAWALSYVSPDLYIAALAEAWLKVVHSAIPPSALAAPSDPQQAVNKRASLGWSALMRASEIPETSASKADETKKWSFGLFGSGDVFRRVFDVQHQTMDSDNEKAQNVARKDVLNDKGDASTLESPSDQMLTATDAMYDLMLGQCGFPPDQRQASNSEAVYEGELNDRGKRHGFGKLSSKDFSYEGYFQNDEASGLGQLRSKELVYIGEYQKGEKNGFGLLSKNGNIYLGQFKDGKREGVFIVRINRLHLSIFCKEDKRQDQDQPVSFVESYEGMRNEQGQRHGQGKAISQVGDMYVGEFYQDKACGSGALFSHKLKGVYMGEMQDNYKHGKGKFFYPDGSVETGTWELGIKLKGKTPKTTDAVSLDLDFKQMTTQPGPDEYAEDELVYEGETNTSRMMHGFGTLRSKSFTYEGFFREGLFSGVGRFQRSNGNLYIGQFEKGVAHGVGLLNVNGTIFLGKFAEAKKQGRFIVSRPARRMINNEFYTDDAVDYTKAASFEDSFEGMRNDQGQRHGQGTAIFKNGDMYVGEFYKDKMHGSGALFFHTLKGVYMGEMRDDLMHGKGKLVSPEGKVQEGTWERGIKHLARRFALEPAKNAEEENARWEDLKSERSLPTYSDFISHQYHSFLSVLYFRFCSRSYLPTRLLAKLLAPFFVWYGFGFCFTYTRSVWYQVLYNYWIFTVSACGVWTREARLLYSVDECLESTKTSEGGREAETDASDRWTRYSRAWASIIAPRCILFMIVPWLTPLMLYSTTMATSPLFIADPEVPLPPWLDFSSFYRRALRDSAGEEQEWIAVLDMIYLFATESRLVQTILNAYKFALSVALWQAGYHKKDLAVKYWVFSALFVFLPYCYVLALKPITYLGKTLGIKNSDLHFRTSTPSASPSPSQSPPAAASPATEGAPSDHIPRSLDRPSVVVTFGNVYSEHDGAMGGAVELRVSEAVKSPLARLDP